MLPTIFLSTHGFAFFVYSAPPPGYVDCEATGGMLNRVHVIFFIDNHRKEFFFHERCFMNRTF